MANEIRVIEGDGQPDTASPPRYDLLFLYTITGVKQAGPPGGSNVNVVPTPSAGVPAAAKALLTAGEITALDGGTLAWERVTFTRDTALSNPQLIAAVQTMYTSRKTDFQRRYDSRYFYANVRVDAP